MSGTLRVSPADFGKPRIESIRMDAAVSVWLWCRGRDSNPQGLLRRILSPLRLPVPPPRPILYFTVLRRGLQPAVLREGLPRPGHAVQALSCIMLSMKNNRLASVFAFVGMMLGTALTGLVIGIILALVLAVFIRNDFGGWGGLVAAGIGMAVGYPLGIIIGQAIIRRVFRYEGSLLLGATGAVVGAALPLGVGEMAPGLFPAGGAAVVLLLLSPLLATVGYHVTRRGKSV